VVCVADVVVGPLNFTVGTIAPQLLRMDPSLSYMMGSWRQQLLWMGVALSIVVGMVALHVVLGI
jgi:hypothetical protein